MHPNRFYISLFISIISCTPVFTQIIAAGDIAFLGFNSDNADQYTIIATNYIEDGTPIYFTDAGWTGSGFYASEGHIRWTVPAGGLPAGTMITFTGGASGAFTTFPAGILEVGANASAGSLTSASASQFALSTSGDQILCYTGSIAAPTFIACVNFNGVWSAAISSQLTLVPSGLTAGVDCVLLNNRDNGIIDCNLLTDPAVTADYNNNTFWIYNDITRYALPPAIGTCDFVLPVTLIDFNALLIDDLIHLTWTTETEIHADHFIVEKSLDGFNFDQAGIINAAGTSTEINKYFFIVDEPSIGINYFRLKIVDENDDFEFSKTISVNSGSTSHQIKIFPNPVINNLNLEFNVNSDQNILIEILNLNGQIISNENLFVEKGICAKKFSIDQLPGGIYFINIISVEINDSVQFVKK